MESLIKYVQDEYIEPKSFPEFKAGDTITVYYEIKEGEKSRTQFFKGVVIQIKGKGKTKTFTIRKMSGTFGIESEVAAMRASGRRRQGTYPVSTGNDRSSYWRAGRRSG